ncbi:MAG TPA: ABC transporter ATP-binding protein [Gaiellaceae bacterium]|nr:ABC transporter ATP-binding protein [Gaiellaceae bacterium]
MPLAVELREVDFAYEHGEPVLRDVNLAIGQGEFVAIAGPNGGGKTTLIRLVLGLERPTRGTVHLFGEPANRFSRREGLGYLAQRAQVGVEAPATVYEVVAAGRVSQRRFLGPLRADDRRVVEQAIDRVGLSDVARRPVDRLSGGQQQRAFIAKALAREPSLLVLDEPTTGVDAESQEALAALLDRLQRELRATVLYVSHEFGAVERYVERVVLVRGGIVFDGRPDELPGVWHDPSHVHV